MPDTERDDDGLAEDREAWLAEDHSPARLRSEIRNLWGSVDSWIEHLREVTQRLHETKVERDQARADLARALEALREMTEMASGAIQWRINAAEGRVPRKVQDMIERQQRARAVLADLSPVVQETRNDG